MPRLEKIRADISRAQEAEGDALRRAVELRQAHAPLAEQQAALADVERLHQEVNVLYLELQGRQADGSAT